MTIASTGLGLAMAAEVKSNQETNHDERASNAIFMVPAATSIIGTIMGQRQVKDVHLTRKQGSTLNLTTVGAALVGLGLATAIQAEANEPSALVLLGIPSGLALIAQQAVFQKFKKQNLLNRLSSKPEKPSKLNMVLNVMPENYFLNQRIQPGDIMLAQDKSPKPVVNLKLEF